MTTPRSTTHKVEFTPAEQFFYDHAGYSRRTDESPASGRARCAILLAAAEEAYERSDAYMVWELDPDADEFYGHDLYGASVSGSPMWSAMLVRDNGDEGYEVLASLGGIDFGEDYEQTPEADPYARVVRAELADEARL